MENVVVYVYAKFGDDQLWKKKALADRKSNNNNNTKKTTLMVLEHPFPV